MIAYLEIDGLAKSPETVGNRIPLLDFDHVIDTSGVGNYKDAPDRLLVIQKRIDAWTPYLIAGVCEGTLFDSARVFLGGQGDAGSARLQLELSGVRLFQQQLNTMNGPSLEDSPVIREQLELRYAEIECVYADPAVETRWKSTFGPSP